jgi:hypothetical protein
MGLVFQFAVWSLCANALAGVVNLEGKLSCAQWKEAHLKKGTAPSELVTLFVAYPGSESVLLKPLGKDAKPEDFKSAVITQIKSFHCPLLAYFELGKTLLSDSGLSRTEKRRMMRSLSDRVFSENPGKASLIEFRIDLALILEAMEQKVLNPSGSLGKKLRKLDSDSAELGKELKKRFPPGGMECVEKESCESEAYRTHYRNLEYEVKTTRQLSNRFRESVQAIRKELKDL